MLKDCFAREVVGQRPTTAGKICVRVRVCQVETPDSTGGVLCSAILDSTPLTMTGDGAAVHYSSDYHEQTHPYPSQEGTSYVYLTRLTAGSRADATNKKSSP